MTHSTPIDPTVTPNEIVANPVVAPGANPPVEAAAVPVTAPEAVVPAPPALKAYTKRPVTIHAIQFDGTRDEVLAAWCGGTLKQNVDESWSIDIETIEGVMTAVAGGYIVQGVEGEFYPVKPSIFESTYDLKG